MEVSKICGIFGTVNNSGLSNQDKKCFEKFFDLQHHRGPNGVGRYVNEKIAIGMVRLSIIDLEHGWQPIWNSDKTICVIANGEIYNHVELRNELELKGHSFETYSDIEVIVHLYEEYGITFVSRLRGMFAFALLDQKKNQLFFGRDRMGEKPLYVAETDSGFSFSSELRTLIQSGIVPFVLDPKVLPNYFLYGFVPEPLTFIKGIRKVEAGTLEIFSLLTNERSVQTYWAMDSNQVSNTATPAQELRSLLDEVGELIVCSDAPVGVALSGGLDSAIIASIAKSFRSDIQSFTVGYTGNHSCDESVDAIKLAQTLGITSHVVKLDTEEIAIRFGEMCLLRDEPIADISGSSYLALAELAQAHGVKVLISGQGSDELFWGYPWVRIAAHWANRRAKTLAGSRQIKDYLQFNRPPRSIGALFEWLKEFGGLKENLVQLREDNKDRCVLSRQNLLYERRPRARKIRKISHSLLTAPAFFVPAHDENPINNEFSTKQVMRILLKTYLRSNGLGQMDKLCMAASVEGRTPFVDHKIVEFALRESLKANSNSSRSKSLLIEATQDLVPTEVLNRPKKGFTPPVRDWYQAIYSFHKEDFAKPKIVDLGLVTNRATRILNRPLSFAGQPNLLWIELATLELWVRGLEKSLTEE